MGRAVRRRGTPRMSLLDRFKVIRAPDLACYRRFVVEGQAVGWIAGDLAARLRDHGHVFTVGDKLVTLSPALRTYAERTAAVDGVLRALRTEVWFRAWRYEPLSVSGHPSRAGSWSGAGRRAGLRCRAYGIHVNGFVGSHTDLCGYWVGRRSPDKPTFPNQPITSSPAASRQSQPRRVTAEELRRGGVAAGRHRAPGQDGRCRLLSMANEEGAAHDVLFTYDLARAGGFRARQRRREIANSPVADPAVIDDSAATPTSSSTSRSCHRLPDPPRYVGPRNGTISTWFGCCGGAPTPRCHMIIVRHLRHDLVGAVPDHLAGDVRR